MSKTSRINIENDNFQSIIQRNDANPNNVGKSVSNDETKPIDLINIGKNLTGKRTTNLIDIFKQMGLPQISKHIYKRVGQNFVSKFNIKIVIAILLPENDEKKIKQLLQRCFIPRSAILHSSTAEQYNFIKSFNKPENQWVEKFLPGITAQVEHINFKNKNWHEEIDALQPALFNLLKIKHLRDKFPLIPNTMFTDILKEVIPGERAFPKAISESDIDNFTEFFNIHTDHEFNPGILSDKSSLKQSTFVLGVLKKITQKIGPGYAQDYSKACWELIKSNKNIRESIKESKNFEINLIEACNICLQEHPGVLTPEILKQEILKVFNRKDWRDYEENITKDFGQNFSSQLLSILIQQDQLITGLIHFKDLPNYDNLSNLILHASDLKKKYGIEAKSEDFIQELNTALLVEGNNSPSQIKEALEKFVITINHKALQKTSDDLTHLFGSNFSKIIIGYLKKLTVLENTNNYLRELPQWKLIQKQIEILTSNQQIYAYLGNEEYFKKIFNEYLIFSFPKIISDEHIENLSILVKEFIDQNIEITNQLDQLNQKIKDLPTNGFITEIKKDIGAGLKIMFDQKRTNLFPQFLEQFDKQLQEVQPYYEQIALLKEKMSDDPRFNELIEDTLHPFDVHGDRVTINLFDPNVMKNTVSQLQRAYNLKDWEKFMLATTDKYGENLAQHLIDFLDPIENSTIRNGKIHFLAHNAFRKDILQVEKQLDKVLKIREQLVEERQVLSSEEFEAILSNFISSYKPEASNIQVYNATPWFITHERPFKQLDMHINKAILEKELAIIQEKTTPKYAKIIRSYLKKHEPKVFKGENNWQGFGYALGNNEPKSEFLSLDFKTQLQTLIPTIHAKKVYPHLNEGILRKYLVESSDVGNIEDLKSKFTLLSKLEEWVATFKVRQTTSVKENVVGYFDRALDKIRSNNVKNDDTKKLQNEFKKQQFAQIFLTEMGDPYYKTDPSTDRDLNRLKLLDYAYNITENGIFEPEVIARAFRKQLDDLTRIKFGGNHTDALEEAGAINKNFQRILNQNLIKEYIFSEARIYCEANGMPYNENIKDFLSSFIGKLQNLHEVANKNSLIYLSDLTKLGLELLKANPLLKHSSILDAIESRDPYRTKFNLTEINSVNPKLTDAHIDRIKYLVLVQIQTMEGRVATWEETLFPLLGKFIPPFCRAIKGKSSKPKDKAAAAAMNHNFEQIEKIFGTSDKIKEDMQTIKPWLLGSAFISFLSLDKQAKATYRTLIPELNKIIITDLAKVKKLDNLLLHVPTLEATLKEAGVTDIAATLLTNFLQAISSSKKKYQEIEKAKDADENVVVVTEGSLEAYTARDKNNAIVLNEAENIFLNVIGGINEVTSSTGFKLGVFFGSKPWFGNSQLLKWIGGKIAGYYLKLHMAENIPFEERHRELLSDNMTKIIENAIILAPIIKGNHDIKNHFEYLRYLERLVKQPTPINIKEFLSKTLLTFGKVAEELVHYEEGIDAIIGAVPLVLKEAS